jgi:hypothetical protein
MPTLGWIDVYLFKDFEQKLPRFYIEYLAKVRKLPTNVSTELFIVGYRS